MYKGSYVYMYLCIYVSMYLCIYVYMYICIYVYMYIVIDHTGNGCPPPNRQAASGCFPSRPQVGSRHCSERHSEGCKSYPLKDWQDANAPMKVADPWS